MSPLRVYTLVGRAFLPGHSAVHPHPPLSQRARGARLPSPCGRRAGDEGAGITLEQILALVVAGCKGDAQAGEQAYQIAQALQQPGAPPEYAPLGKMLQRFLEGLRGAGGHVGDFPLRERGDGPTAERAEEAAAAARSRRPQRRY